MNYSLTILGLKDDVLLSQLNELVQRERQVTVQILAHIGEVEARKLFAVMGYSSMFQWAVEKLGYSEASALKRIQVARAARRFPQILTLIEDMKISLTAVMKLVPYLNTSNHEELLSISQGKTVKEVEDMVSRRFPRSAGPDCVKPIDEDHIRFSFSGKRVLKDMVDEARDYFRHKYPGGRLGDIFFEAMELLIEKKRKERTAIAMSRKVKEGSRHIGKRVKVAVWKKYDGRCAYVSPEGRRCPETGNLEWDHKLPWALGGKSDEDNIRLLCRTHNRLMADRYFGREYIEGQIAKKYQGKERDLCMNQFQLATWMEGGEVRPIKEAGPRPK